MSFLSKFKTYIVLVSIILALFGTIKYLYSELSEAKQDLTDAGDAFNNTLILENASNYNRGLADAGKKVVIKNQDKLKTAIKERGEINNEKHSNFTIYKF